MKRVLTVVVALLLLSSSAFAQSTPLTDAAVASAIAAPAETVTAPAQEAPRASGWVRTAQATFLASQVLAIAEARGTTGPMSFKETLFLRSFLGANTLLQSHRIGKDHPKATAVFLFLASSVDIGLAARQKRVAVNVAVK